MIKQRFFVNYASRERTTMLQTIRLGLRVKSTKFQLPIYKLGQFN